VDSGSGMGRERKQGAAASRTRKEMKNPVSQLRGGGGKKGGDQSIRTFSGQERLAFCPRAGGGGVNGWGGRADIVAHRCKERWLSGSVRGGGGQLFQFKKKVRKVGGGVASQEQRGRRALPQTGRPR